MEQEKPTGVQETREEKAEHEREAERQESLAEFKRAFAEEMEASVTSFKAEDDEVGRIEVSAHLSDPSYAEEVKGELHLAQALEDLDRKADSLKEEFAVAPERELGEKDIAGAKLFCEGERKMAEAQKEMAALMEKKEEAEGNEGFALREKMLRVKMLEARGDMLQGKGDLSDEDIERAKEAIAKREAEAAAPKGAQEKNPFDEIGESMLRSFDKLDAVVRSTGYSFEQLHDFEYSEDPKEKEAVARVEELVASDENFTRFDGIVRQHPNEFLSLASQAKIPYMVKEMASEALECRGADAEKVFGIIDSGTLSEKQTGDLLDDVRIKLEKDRQEALMRLPVEEVLAEWDREMPSGWGWQGSRETEGAFAEKLGEHLDALSKDHRDAEIGALREKLDDMARRGYTPSFAGACPGWLRDLHLDADEKMSLLTHAMPLDSFRHHFHYGRKYVPLHVVPEGLLPDEKENIYRGIFFKRNLSYADVEEYARMTGLGVEDAVSKATQSSGLIAEQMLGMSGIQEHKEFFIENALGKVPDATFFSKMLQEGAQFSELLAMPEARAKALAGFKRHLGVINVDTISRAFKAMPFLREGFDESDSPYDIALGVFMKDVQAMGGARAERLGQVENIKESFWVKEAREKLPEAIAETAERFEGKYGNKGRDLVALAVAAYGSKNPENFAAKMRSMEQVLDKYDSENIPEGAKVSMGIEYEVTRSMAEAYGAEGAMGYKQAIQTVSESANIGKGYDAVHEIATKPTYNPYMLMAEVKLLQDAGFLDFNFQKYPGAPRGYHMSLVGDGGLRIDGGMHFLNNALMMGQLTGITAGDEVMTTKGVYEKGFEHFSNANQKGVRCEMKGMGADSVEQFERAVLTAHHAGIAMQLANKYLHDPMMLHEADKGPGEFEAVLGSSSAGLLAPFGSDQERDIVYAWEKLKYDMVAAVNQHNASFSDSEFRGFVLKEDGSYVDTGEHIDLARNKKLVDEAMLESGVLNTVVHINPQDLFASQKPELVNALTRTNNIFLKPPQLGDKSSVNAKAVLDTMKQEGYGEAADGTARESIFDRKGEMRDGYYCVQGASEEMIVHKAQILLNRFNAEVEKCLAQKGVKREAAEQTIAA
jgi:hypothetical protein